MDLTVKSDLDRKSKRQTSTPVQPSMATIHDDDERLLARIGYKQVIAAQGSCDYHSGATI